MRPSSPWCKSRRGLEAGDAPRWQDATTDNTGPAAGHRRAIGCALVTLGLLATGSAPATASQRQEASRTFDRTLPVAPGQRLRVEHTLGDVRITTHARGELRVQAEIRVSAESQPAAAELVEQIRIEVVEDPAAVTIRTHYPDRASRRSRRDVSYSVDYSVVMPERMPLDVRNSFGAVTVTGVQADAAIVNAHGTLRLADGAGRHRLENSFGPVDVARLAGDVTVTGTNGHVSAATIGGQLTVTNRFGRVTATAVRGSAHIVNSNGQVEVTDAGSANVTSSFGAVTLRDVRANVVVASSNGSVTAATIAGAARVKGSFGNVQLTGVTGDVTVENANGDVRLANVGGAVDVRGSFGRVEAQGVKAGVRIATANSSVRVTDAGGPVFIKTTFGLVVADGIRGPLTVDNANGGVQASGITGGAEVKTSFGPVMLSEVDGRIDVRNQNGAIDVAPAAKPGSCHDTTLVTSFAPIQVRLPPGGYVVSARTSFGRIHSEIPITATGALGNGALSGTIGPGGCALQLTNSNGDIRILKGVQASR
ncbi:MAG: hypothetical protein ACRD26_23625 [Vicinamibacterales bacterium]